MSDDDPILRCEEERRAAQLAGDVATLDRLIDADLAFVAIDGRTTLPSGSITLECASNAIARAIDTGTPREPEEPVRSHHSCSVPVAAHTLHNRRFRPDEAVGGVAARFRNPAGCLVA